MADWQNVVVVGMGYIGLPTCAMFASKGISVTGVDVNERVVECVSHGEIHIVEPDLDGLIQKVVSNGKLKASLVPEPADAFVIAVPTPLKENHKPDIDFVLAATRSIAPFVKKGDLVVLESTSPVGTTREISRLLGTLREDMTFPHAAGENADVLVAYSPERVLPGRVLTELVQNDRSIGGLSRRSSDRARSLYTTFVAGELVVASAEAAELVKLTENAFRDVNIAFANELAAVCEHLNLNVWEVIELANRHPRVNILQPGPGVGGHCIAVDPYFIIDAAPDHTPLMNVAREINNARPRAIVSEVKRMLDGKKKRATIACLGLSFKPNIDDLRESPAVEIAKLLAEEDVGHIIACEPNVSMLPRELADLGVEFRDALTAIDRADLVLLLVDHRQFRLIDPDALSGKLLVDTRGLWTWRNHRGRPRTRSGSPGSIVT